MKIYIKKDGRLYSVYRITRSRNGQLISGSFAPFANLLGSAIQGLADIHFSYPADGDVHYTVKTDNDQSVRGYWDRLVFRPSGVEIPRNPHYPLFNLLPAQKPHDLREYQQEPHFYQIASSSFNLGDTPYFTPDNASRSRPRPDDIVIDAGAYSWINMLGFLIGYESDFRFQAPNTQMIMDYKLDDSAYPHIHTIVTVTVEPPESSNTLTLTK